MTFLSEAAVEEEALLAQLQTLGYQIEREEDIGPDGKRPERESHAEVILRQRLEDAVARLNPGQPLEARQDAVRRVTHSEFPVLLEENRRLHWLMVEGVDVEYYADDGTLTAGKVVLIDFEHPERNDWLAVSQFVVIQGQSHRRPDVVVFVNGLPLGVIELKAPGSEDAHLLGAFQQLQTYKQQIPALFHTNALLLTSDGIAARVGSLSADIERYHANAITTAEVLQELIQIAKDIRAARQRGEEQGLSDEEIAFYDALAENDSAVQVMGDDALKLIAHELLMSLRENVTVDWAHRESARARMRVLVKRILRKYGYPPDLQDAAVQTVLQQAEALSAEWSVGAPSKPTNEQRLAPPS